jgi:hypothetical protein
MGRCDPLDRIARRSEIGGEKDGEGVVVLDEEKPLDRLNSAAGYAFAGDRETSLKHLQHIPEACPA